MKKNEIDAEKRELYIMIKMITNEIIKEVVNMPLYAELKHKTLSENYHNGVKEYYIIEKTRLLEEIPNRSCFGNAWVNSGLPKLKINLITLFYLSQYENLWLGKEILIPTFEKFVKEDFRTFMHDYYAFNRYIKEIKNNPTILPNNLTTNSISKIGVYLKRNSYIDSHKKWMFRFGRPVENYYDAFGKIIWSSSPNSLANIIYQICGSHLTKQINDVFALKDNKNIYKPNMSKHIDSKLYKDIQDLIEYM